MVYSSVLAQVKDEGGQVYISDDQGVNWQMVGAGLPDDASISSFVLKDNKIIAGTDADGIYISDDKAKNWYRVGLGLPRHVRITALIAYKQLLFAGTYLNGIYFSSDDGDTWRAANAGLKNLTIRSFSTVGPHLFAGTNDGIYSTLNNGESWSPLKKGVQVNSFSVSGKNILAATNVGVFVSGDYGKNWEWTFKDAAIFKIGVGPKELYLLDFHGNVYQSHLSKFVWLKAGGYLPFAQTFQLTPFSTKFFNVEWNNVFKNLQGVNPVLHSYGLPENSAFRELLYTPFGILAFAKSKKGC